MHQIPSWINTARPAQNQSLAFLVYGDPVDAVYGCANVSGVLGQKQFVSHLKV